MLISERSLDRYKLTIIHYGVDGIFAVKYDEPLKPAKPKLYEDCYNWKHHSEGDCYTLVLPKPTPRNVIYSLVLRRTSINRYEVTFASVDCCESVVCKSMSAVHEVLAPLVISAGGTVAC